MKKKITIHWFRRDLRIEDNTALFAALRNHAGVLPLFIFDTSILSGLPPDDARVTFIYKQLERLQDELKELQSGLLIRIGTPREVWRALIEEFDIQAVYANRDYEPYARQRDQNVAGFLHAVNIPFHLFRDHVIYEQDEIVKDDGAPYTVYTPYSRKWKETLDDSRLAAVMVKPLSSHFRPIENAGFPTLQSIGFIPSSIIVPPSATDIDLISHYHETRDYPAKNGTSKLGIHLRFGTISLRSLMRVALTMNQTFLNELIWREFYQMIIWHFPHVVTTSFRAEYENLQWRNNENEFRLWCEGKTGYPLVDAGMRELNATGFMHNRVRMITASFLTKHLLIDWRWGEAYFATRLLDYELASNNGNWQWAAGTGVDAAPYFRIFNPAEQQKKFDPAFEYIRKWIPEFDTPDYPAPIVDHKYARERALRIYKEALSAKK